MTECKKHGKLEADLPACPLCSDPKIPGWFVGVRAKKPKKPCAGCKDSPTPCKGCR